MSRSRRRARSGRTTALHALADLERLVAGVQDPVEQDRVGAVEPDEPERLGLLEGLALDADERRS